MTERPSFKDGVQHVWDSTSLKMASRCPRLYEYRMIHSIVPKTSRVDLIFGSFYATALEHFYKYRAEGLSIEDALIEVVTETLLSSWGIVFDHESKTRFNLIRSIVWYIDEFGEESRDAPQTHILSSGKPAVELSFMLEMAPNIVYAGHLDRVVEYGGGLHWMDQKTTGKSLSQWFANTYTPDIQFTGYTWAGESILGSPFKGGIMDAAQIAVGFTRFQRFFIQRSASIIEEWLRDTKEIITRTQEYTRNHYFPMNREACFNCGYRMLCSLNPRMRDHFIQTEYVQISHWEPAVPR